MRLYYAQNKEDLLIKGFFPDVSQGFYIDVGANDPVIDSVTKLFYDEGWSGINIDPIRKHINDLNSARPRDINLQAGLSDELGELTFREYQNGDGLSTFDAGMRAQYEKTAAAATAKFKDYKVPLTTLSDVIKDHKVKKVHFIKIDVEGYEYEVIRGYDWTAVRPELICIEANHINRDWRPILAKHGYTLVFFDGLNNYYLAKESMNRQELFNYPNTVFAGRPVYYPAFLEIKEATENQLEKDVVEPIKAQNQQLKDKIRDQEQQIAFLHRQQRDVRFLARRLAQEMQLRLNKRAQGVQDASGLRYADDQAIQDKLKSDAGKEELVAFIHQRDSKNIRSRRAAYSGQAKTALWKAAAGSFNTGLKVAKKTGRRVHGGR